MQVVEIDHSVIDFIFGITLGECNLFIKKFIYKIQKTLYPLKMKMIPPNFENEDEVELLFKKFHESCNSLEILFYFTES